MSEEFVASGEESFTSILIQRRRYGEDRPSLRWRDQAVIRSGPQVYRVAKHVEVVDHATQEHHHHSVTIDTYKHTKSQWTLQIPKQLTITDEHADEISALRDFLSTVRGGLPSEPGDYLVIRVDDSQLTRAQASDLMRLLSSRDKAVHLSRALEATNNDPEALWELVDTALANPHASGTAAAALNLAVFTAAHEHLKRLIDEDANERSFQRHLEGHPWIFGSEYSELLDERHWTRDEQQDFMVRRTVDEYIELIEIKTPLNGRPLFRYDESHDAYFASSELSRVHGQVMKYLQRLDDDRLRIKALDGEDANKIRAKIIIGRDGDANEREALRRYNSHLHRIEVITFDQLLRIGQRVLDHLHQVIEPLGVAKAGDDTLLGELPF